MKRFRLYPPNIVLVTVLSILTLGIAGIAYASPLYTPGQTLNPQCLPTNPDCTVATSTIGTAAAISVLSATTSLPNVTALAGLTSVGALTSGSIGVGFGNVNIGSNIFTGNGSGLTNLNASNINAGTLGVSNGGTGASSFGQGWVYSNGGTGALNSSTSPTVAYLVATSTKASIFPYASTTALTVSGASGLTVGTLNGPLSASNGAVTATSSIGVFYGGTGLSSAPSYGQIMVGNSTSGYTLMSTSSLGLSSIATTTAVSARYVISWWGDSLSMGYNTGIAPVIRMIPYLNFPVQQVYPMAWGGQTTAQIAARFFSDSPRWGDYTVIWAGTNDTGFGLAGVQSTITSMVNALPYPQHFVILSPFDNPTVASTSVEHVAYLAFNAAMASAYPNNWLNVFNSLLTTCNPIGASTNFPSYGVNNTQWYASTTQDQIDCGQLAVPTSLRDGVDVHLSPTGYNMVAQWVANFINADTTLTQDSKLQAVPTNMNQLAATIGALNGIEGSSTLESFFFANGGMSNSQTAGLTATGMNNIGIGYSTMSDSLTTGYQNIMIGAYSGRKMATGYNNIAIGASALQFDVSDSDNIAIGYASLEGAGLSGSNTEDIGIDSGSLQNLDSGVGDIGIGLDSLYNKSGGNGSTAVGDRAGMNETTGIDNTYLGAYTGGPWLASYANTTGSNDTFIGYSTSPASSTQISNSTCLGSNCQVALSNSMVFGNGVTTSGFGTSTPYANLSVQNDYGNANTALFSVASSTSSNGNSANVLFSISNTGVFTASTTNSSAATSTIYGNLYVTGTLRSKTSYNGDLIFANGFDFTEAPLDGTPQGLFLKNQNGAQVLSIDDAGNLTVPGDVCANGAQCFGASLSALSADVSALSTSTSLSILSANAETGQSISELSASVSSTSQSLAMISAQMDALSSTTAMLQSALATSTVASTTASAIASGPSFVQIIAAAVQDLIQSAGNWAVDQITAALGVFDTVQTKELCVDGTCITGDQLKQILKNENLAAAAMPAPSVAVGTSTITVSVPPPFDGASASTSIVIAATTTDATTTAVMDDVPTASSTPMISAPTASSASSADITAPPPAPPISTEASTSPSAIVAPPPPPNQSAPSSGDTSSSTQP